MGGLEFAEGAVGMLPSTLAEDTNNTEREVPNDDAYQLHGDGTSWNTDSQENLADGVWQLFFFCSLETHAYSLNARILY